MSEKEKTNKKLTQYHKLQDKVTKKLDPLFHGAYSNHLTEQISSGQNKYLKFHRFESSSYDPRWLDEIENTIPDIDFIIKNPKKVIENVTEVVPVELARKTNADSVKHLATHSQYVKDINDKGDVIPNKILNIRSDDFYQTYENRFIATLIRRLILFIEKRYQFIIQNTLVRETEYLYVKNYSIIDGKKVEIETKVKIYDEEEFSEELKQKNEVFMARLEEIRKYMLFFYNSEFMKMMKTERNVRNPILMTNILRKNHRYNHCVHLYKFIEKYDALGIDFKVNDSFELLNDEQIRELNNTLVVNYLSLRGKEVSKDRKQKIKKSKPKVLTSIDDEEFTYGVYHKGPFEFVRVDQECISELKKLQVKNLPEKPTKEEKEFYKEEYENNKRIEKEIDKKEKLKAKKSKQAIIDDKKFSQIVAEREKEEALEREKREQEIRDNALKEIEKARNALVGESIPSSTCNIETSTNDEESIINNREINNANDDYQEEVIETPVDSQVEDENVSTTTEEENDEIVEETTNESIEENNEETSIDSPIEEKNENDIKQEESKNNDGQVIEEISKEELVPETTVIEEKKEEENDEPQKEKKSRNIFKRKNEEDKKEEDPFADIDKEEPYQYVVKTKYGYYVKDNYYSVYLEDSRLFETLKEAKKVASKVGGKVIIL